MHDDLAEHLRAVDEVQVVEGDSDQRRRALDADLGVQSDYQGVRVVANVRPTPEGRFPEHHERGDVVHDIVRPAAAECRAMTVLVPAGIAGAAPEGAEDRERRN